MWLLAYITNHTFPNYNPLTFVRIGHRELFVVWTDRMTTPSKTNVFSICWIRSSMFARVFFFFFVLWFDRGYYPSFGELWVARNAGDTAHTLPELKQLAGLLLFPPCSVLRWGDGVMASLCWIRRYADRERRLSFFYFFFVSLAFFFFFIVVDVFISWFWYF